MFFLIKFVGFYLTYNDVNRYNTTSKGSRGPNMVLDIRQHSNALGI